MALFAQPAHPAGCTQFLSLFAQNRGPVQAGQQVAGSGRVSPQAKRTNPNEPIEVKLCRLNEMYEIFIKRTHWCYVLYTQLLPAKKGRFFGRAVPLRTRICGRGGAQGRPCLKTKLECPLDSAGSITRLLS